MAHCQLNENPSLMRDTHLYFNLFFLISFYILSTVHPPPLLPRPPIFPPAEIPSTPSNREGLPWEGRNNLRIGVEDHLLGYLNYDLLHFRVRMSDITAVSNVGGTY